MKKHIKELPQNRKLLRDEFGVWQIATDQKGKKKLKVVSIGAILIIVLQKSATATTKVKHTSNGALWQLNWCLHNGVALVLCYRLSDNRDGNGQRMTNINRDGVNHRGPLSDTQQVQAFVQHFTSCIYSSLSVIPVIIRIILIELKLQLLKKRRKSIYRSK